MKRILKCEGITKIFPGVKALDNVSFSLNEGELLAVCGENGAGKSTLIKILGGVYQKTEGKIFWMDKEVDIKTPLDSQELGIGVVHQDFPLATDLSVLENIYLGRIPTKGKTGLVDWKKLRSDAVALLRENNISLDLDKKLGDLSISDRQLVAIVKAVSTNAKLVILDEPTSSLSKSEAELLFKLIKHLKDKNIAVIYISHRLEELLDISDKFLVLRDGQVVLEEQRENVDLPIIIKAMVGREIIEEGIDRSEFLKDQPVVLKVENFSVSNKVKNINFEVKKGEILGIGGLVGAGRSEILEGIMGYRPTTGNIYLNKELIKIKEPIQAMKKGFGFVPEDRKKEGIFPGQTVQTNISIASFEKIYKNGLINRKKEKNLVQNVVNQFNVKTPSLNQKIDYLSGGNQQKAIFSRWVMKNSKILLLDEPTNGVDIGAKEEIYQHMYNMVDQGLSIIMVSSDLRELLRISDRILVIYEGEINGERLQSEASQDWFMEAASGL